MPSYPRGGRQDPGHNRLPSVPKIGGDPAKPPPLPARAPDGEPWRPMARRWWLTWRELGLRHGFSAPQWDTVLATVPLSDQLWRGNVVVAGELRRREELLARIVVARPGMTTALSERDGGPARERLVRLLGEHEA